MEIKKSTSADLSRLNVPIILLGLLFTSSIVLAAFTYSTPDLSNGNDDKKTRAVDNTIETQEQDETPPPPPEDIPQIDIPQPPQEDIKQEDNKVEPPKTITAPPIPPPVPVGKKDVPPPAEIIDYPDKEASFPGGAAAMQRWIQEHVKYPETSRELGEQGKVYVQFVVEPNGDVTGVEVIRKVSSDLDREAARVVRAMPNWEPGESKAKKVRTRVRLPINFTLQ